MLPQATAEAMAVNPLILTPFYYLLLGYELYICSRTTPIFFFVTQHYYGVDYYLSCALEDIGVAAAAS